ncbi:MAG: adenosylmethionine--8-amino-7-oxononanoate transaminase [Betaproteobacteria bacterium]|nr:adenosylmethionine--8-amino-7-oxononanoate transaminase [Betaproteobacteria bacterium]
MTAPPSYPREHDAVAANAQWLARSRAAVWHPCTQMKAHESLPLVPIARGAGAWLYDFAGNRYLDAVSSWWVNLFGHANPRISSAVMHQLGELEHVMLAGFTHRPVVELSERLAALAPAGLGHAFYASDGASATEIALKMSFHYWHNVGRSEKRTFVSLVGSYHGETLGALSVTDVALFRDAYAPLLRSATTVPCPDRRSGLTTGAAADALEAYLEQHHATTAALIVEPLVQGASGMVMYDAAYLALARELCTRYDVHLIADEIMTGFGRTGTLFAWEQTGAPAPDFLCLSKGMTGGFLPLSCVLTTDAIYTAFYADDLARAFLHSHSYTGNALACRAALEVLNIFRDDDVIAVNRARARALEQSAAPLAAHPNVRNFRSCGMIWAFEVDSQRPDFSRWFFAEALAQELLLRPIGNTLYFMPPYTLSDDEFALLAERTLEIVGRA